MPAIHFDWMIDDSEFPKDTHKMLKEIRPRWIMSQVCFTEFTEGLSNRVILACHEDDKTDMIVIKVFGSINNGYVDRIKELKYTILASNYGYAPRVLATFENGYAYSYVQGDVLTRDTVHCATIYRQVAKLIAKLHKLRNGPDTPRHSEIWALCSAFIDKIPHSNDHNFLEKFPAGVEYLKKELQELSDVFQNVRSPVVFCHNDLLLSNIIYDGQTVIAIDFEYGCYNWQAMDIANHFAEFAGTTDFDASFYPNEEVRLDWLHAYLEEYNSSGVTAEEVRSLNNIVRRFFPVAHFFWGVWSVMQNFTSSIQFDYMKYASQKFEEYLKYKNDIYGIDGE